MCNLLVHVLRGIVPRNELQDARCVASVLESQTRVDIVEGMPSIFGMVVFAQFVGMAADALPSSTCHI